MKKIRLFITMTALIWASMLLVACASQQSGNTQTGDTTDHQQYTPEKKFKIEKINDGKAIQIIKYRGRETVVNIPPTIQGLPVTSIGAFTFSVKKVIKKMEYARKYEHIFATAPRYPITNVTIPDSVTSIGNFAFAQNLLTNVTIPGSVNSIGEAAFEDNKLISVIILNGVEYIGTKAFDGNQIADVTIPSSITWIGGRAFPRIISITMPANVRFGNDPNSTASTAIGQFTKAYLFNDRKAGLYTKQGNHFSYSDGDILVNLTEQAERTKREKERPLKENAFLYVHNGRVRPSYIDGKPISEYYFATRKVGHVEVGKWYILSPGLHTFSGIYSRGSSYTTTRYFERDGQLFKEDTRTEHIYPELSFNNEVLLVAGIKYEIELGDIKGATVQVNIIPTYYSLPTAW